MGFGNKKSCFTIEYARYNKTHTAEGVLTMISPNIATYSIGAHHNFLHFNTNFSPFVLLASAPILAMAIQL